MNIEAEFWRAIRFAKATMMDWPLSPRVQWGIANVALYGFGHALYEPVPDGRLAFIAPVVEGGELIDLCAIDPDTKHVATRLGYGHGLGVDAIEKARMRCSNLVLCSNAMSWLRWAGCLHSIPDTQLPADAVYLFDLRWARVALDGVAPIHCQTIELAERVMAVLPESETPRVMVL